jgi:hypothetical protein
MWGRLGGNAERRHAIASVLSLLVDTAALIGATLLGPTGTECEGALDFSGTELLEIDQISSGYE